MTLTIIENNLKDVTAVNADPSKLYVGFDALIMEYNSTTQSEPKTKTTFQITLWVYNDNADDKENTPQDNYWCYQEAQVESDDDGNTDIINIEHEYKLDTKELYDLTPNQIIERIKEEYNKNNEAQVTILTPDERV